MKRLLPSLALVFVLLLSIVGQRVQTADAQIGPVTQPTPTLFPTCATSVLLAGTGAQGATCATPQPTSTPGSVPTLFPTCSTGALLAGTGAQGATCATPQPTSTPGTVPTLFPTCATSVLLAGTGAQGATCATPQPTSTPLPVGAVTQTLEIKDTTAANTTSASLVDVDATNCIVTMTTVSGSTVIVDLDIGTQANTTTALESFGLSVDSGGGLAPQPRYYAVGVNFNTMTHGRWVVTGLSAASHTFKPQWATSAGTQNLDTQPGCHLVVQEFRK